MKKGLGLLFAVFYFLFFIWDASPQTYIVTETQLQKLEEICQKYKVNNQKLTEQLNELALASEESEKESTLLKEQLKLERNSTQSLNESLLTFETKAAQSEAEKVQALLDLEKQQTQNAKQKTIIVILSSILGGLILITGTVLVMRFFKK